MKLKLEPRVPIDKEKFCTDILRLLVASSLKDSFPEPSLKTLNLLHGLSQATGTPARVLCQNILHEQV